MKIGALFRFRLSAFMQEGTMDLAHWGNLMLNRTIVAAILMLGLSACISQAQLWDATRWAEQEIREYNEGRFRFSAQPWGDGFKLKLVIKLDAVSGQAIETISAWDLAIQAAPPGCVPIAVDMIETGDIVADYDCTQSNPS